MGGSVLWNPQAKEVSQLKLGIIAQPVKGYDVALAFDHTGTLSASAKASSGRLSARLFGALDVNGRGGGDAGGGVGFRAGDGGNKAGFEVSYDVPAP